MSNPADGVTTRKDLILSLWMRDPDAPHAWMRIVKGGDPHHRAARRVFVEKTPRVHDPAQGQAPTTPQDHPRCSWIDGPKGHADDGDGPDLSSRRWADEKARELGYVLPDMQNELTRLKTDWNSDGGWDLEDSEGFEEYRDELIAYRKQVERARAERRAKEYEAAIAGLIQPALDFLPEYDERGGLTRDDAARLGHSANQLLRAVAEMLLPLVQRLDSLRIQRDMKHDTKEALSRALGKVLRIRDVSPRQAHQFDHELQQVVLIALAEQLLNETTIVPSTKL